MSENRVRYFDTAPAPIRAYCAVSLRLWGFPEDGIVVTRRAFATDYDGTLADSGTVARETLESLALLRQEGWQLLLVTGRELPDLERVFPDVGIFHSIVAENGALLHHPGEGVLKLLAEAPGDEFVRRLRRRGVQLGTGRVVVGTHRRYEAEVRDVITEMQLPLAVIFNKEALMVLPAGVDKRSGLEAALGELQIGWDETVGIGDAENDLVFLGACGLAIATANGLPSVQERAHWVTDSPNGAGVREAVERIRATKIHHPLR